MAKTRKIHVNLSEETHRKLRVRCAVDDLTIQQFVEGLIEEALKDIDPSAVQKHGKRTGKIRGEK